MVGLGLDFEGCWLGSVGALDLSILWLDLWRRGSLLAIVGRLGTSAREALCKVQ